MAELRALAVDAAPNPPVRVGEDHVHVGSQNRIPSRGAVALIHMTVFRTLRTQTQHTHDQLLIAEERIPMRFAAIGRRRSHPGSTYERESHSSRDSVFFFHSSPRIQIDPPGARHVL